MSRPPSRLRKIPCADVARHVEHELDGRLHASAYRRIRDHLKRCPNCTAYLDSLKNVVYLYQHLTTPGLSGRQRKQLHTVLRLRITRAH